MNCDDMIEEYYFAQVGGEPRGPVSLQDLEKMLVQGLVSRDVLVWRRGMKSWCPVSEVLQEQTSSSFIAPLLVRACPPNYLVLGICATLCCCLPLGLISCMYACRVDNLYRRGCFVDAVRASESAYMWGMLALILGLLSCCIFSTVNLPLSIFGW